MFGSGNSSENTPPTAASPASSKDQPSLKETGKRRSSAGRASSLFNRGSGNSDENSKQSPLQNLLKTNQPITPQPSMNGNNSAGDSKPGPRSTFRVGVTEDKNKKCRRTMEDTHSFLYNFLSSSPSSNSSSGSSSAIDESIETDNGYFAIFDGHAGTYAADWCGRKLHHVLEEQIRKNPSKPIPELLDMTFTSADSQLEKLPVKNSGCTAVCAVLRWEDRIPGSNSLNPQGNAPPGTPATAKAGDKGATNDENAKPATEPKPKIATEKQRVLYTANVGDARIVLCRNGKALRLSYDHKGSDENEGKRVANAGGLILNNRVNGVLAVTRALGDNYMKELVTGHPYTTETVIQAGSDEFIILACDGLWDVCSDQEAVDLIRNIKDAQEASKVLVDHALARFSTDNLSCMVVRLDPPKKFDDSLKPKIQIRSGSDSSNAILDESDTTMGEPTPKPKTEVVTSNPPPTSNPTSQPEPPPASDSSEVAEIKEPTS